MTKTQTPKDQEWEEYTSTLKNPDGSWEKLAARSEERQEMYAGVHDEPITEEDRDFTELLTWLWP